jgi:LysR family glycine cleavage system transcriptional activator
MLVKRLPSLNALRAFSVAAEVGSFTLAGELLHVTQGAISRQIKQLEISLGVTLFNRTHPKIELTPAGRELAQELKLIFEQMGNAVYKSQGHASRQMLSVNVPPTFATRWLAPRLSDFRAKFPQIDLSITTDRIQNIREARSIDCLIFFAREPWSHSFCEPIMQERHIIASSAALWRDGKPLPLAHATLLHILDGDHRIPVWESWIKTFGLQDVDPQPGLHFSTLDQAINAAIVGAGVVVVDEAMIVPELKSGALLAHSAQFINGPNGYWFVQNSNSGSAVYVEQFKHWLMQHVRISSANVCVSTDAAGRP